MSGDNVWDLNRVKKKEQEEEEAEEKRRQANNQQQEQLQQQRQQQQQHWEQQQQQQQGETANAPSADGPTVERTEGKLGIAFTKDKVVFKGNMRQRNEGTAPGNMGVQIASEGAEITGDIEQTNIGGKNTSKGDCGQLQVALAKDKVTLDGSIRSESKNVSGRQDINVAGNDIEVTGDIVNNVSFDS